MHYLICIPVLLQIVFHTKYVSTFESNTISKHTLPVDSPSLNVVLGNTNVNADNPTPLAPAISLSQPAQSTNSLADAVKEAVVSSNALKQQKELQDKEELEEEMNEKARTRRIQLSEAEKAVNEKREKNIHKNHELHERQEEFRHNHRKKKIHYDELEKNENERLNALSDEEAQLEEEDIGLHEAENRAEESVEDMKENLQEIETQAKQKENHDIKKAIADEKRKRLHMIHEHSYPL